MEYFVNFMIGIIGSLIASFIFIWFKEQKDNRRRINCSGIKIRNILYNAEMFLQQNPFLPITICGPLWNPILIDENRLSRGWVRWESQIENIKSELFNIFSQTDMIDFFKVDPMTVISGNRTVKDHFADIESVILSAGNYKHLGLIEVAVEASNLLVKLESDYNDFKDEYKKLEIFINKHPDYTYDIKTDILKHNDGSSRFGVREKLDKLEKTRKQVVLHREFLEWMLSRFK